MKLISVVQQYGQHFVIYIPRIERTEKGNLIIMHASITHIKKNIWSQSTVYKHTRQLLAKRESLHYLSIRYAALFYCFFFSVRLCNACYI